MKAMMITAMALAVAGCNTTPKADPTKEDIAINVIPSSASIKTSNGFECSGSCTINVKRKQAFSIVASAPGYQTETVDVASVLIERGAGDVAFDILLTKGIAGVLTETAMGIHHTHPLNPVNIQLEKNGVRQIPVVTQQAVPAAPVKPVS